MNQKQTEELSELEENILFLSRVIANYPSVSTERIQDAYIDAGLEINNMSSDEKRMTVDEVNRSLKCLREPTEEVNQDED